MPNNNLLSFVNLRPDDPKNGNIFGNTFVKRGNTMGKLETHVGKRGNTMGKLETHVGKLGNGFGNLWNIVGKLGNTSWKSWKHKMRKLKTHLETWKTFVKHGNKRWKRKDILKTWKDIWESWNTFGNLETYLGNLDLIRKTWKHKTYLVNLKHSLKNLKTYLGNGNMFRNIRNTFGKHWNTHLETWKQLISKY